MFAGMNIMCTFAPAFETQKSSLQHWNNEKSKSEIFFHNMLLEIKKVFIFALPFESKRGKSKSSLI